ncbi:outer membrane beta-barrel protein [Bradyrhizobium sp. U531]|uniref:outer membrane protein n=1 Tax=Bradyrhizobium sp. U531 TaxID=3053458 RepID=UPI003F427EAD
MIKKLAIAATALVLGTAGASAADLAARPYTKAPPMVAAVYDWSGFYIGANGGWGTSRNCWDATTALGVVLTPALAEGCHDSSGGTVGGQIGYRWQASQWVFGLEAQGNWADFNGSNVSIGFPAVTNRTRIDAFGLFTGQVGYAWNNALLYVKGGAAVTSNDYTGFNAAGVAFDGASQTRWGATVGVGMEYGFAPNWSVGVEYNHLFMGDHNVSMISNGVAGPAGVVTRIDRVGQDVDMVTARVNYRFGGPSLAKY